MGAVFSGTATVAAGMFTTLVVLFYLLVSGETFLRRFVEILPSFAEKRQAVEITLHIERNVSAYLITVTLINFIVGLLTFGIMAACGVANPLLWGVIAFALNFVPILGAMVGIVLFLMASVLSLGVYLVGAASGRSVFPGPRPGRRDRHAHAAGAPLHHQSRRRDPCADLLVLDVGRARRHPRGAHVGDHQDRLRRPAPAAGIRTLPGSLSRRRLICLRQPGGLIKVPSIKQIGLVAAVAIVAVGATFISPPRLPADSNRVQGRTSDLLRSQFNLDSIFFNNIQDVSGNIFSDRRECTAQVTQIKGNTSPTAMSWRQLRYSIAPGTEPDLPDIKIDLGPSGPYVPPPPTLWERIFGLNNLTVAT